MSLTTRVLLALAAGVALGLALSTTHAPVALEFVAIVEPIGTLFLNAIRMTVIPLVVSLLVVGIAGAPEAAAIGRLGWRAVALFIVLLLAAGVLGAAVARPLFARLAVPASTAGALRAMASEGARATAGAHVQSFGEWLTSLVPANPVAAAASGAMLPLIVFAVGLGLALLALDRERRLPVLAFFRGLADAMLVLVRWILVLAPLGVFALALPLVARLGASALGVLAMYLVATILDAALCIGLLYPATALVGRVSLMGFARAAGPGQAVALSSRSSLAALPALIEGARTRLGLPDEATSFLLPLASATFRIGASGGLTVGTLFLARLYGIELSLAQVATVIVTATLTSFSIPGVPAAFIVAMVPVLGSVGLPLQGLGILLGVDTIPDSFRTTANVTGQIAVAAMLGGREAAPGDRP